VAVNLSGVFLEYFFQENPDPGTNNQPASQTIRTAQNIKTSVTPENTDAEHSAPELLKFNCSGLGLESGWPVGLSTAIKHLDCAPSSLSKQLCYS
jgi:hypothetical protein